MSEGLHMDTIYIEIICISTMIFSIARPIMLNLWNDYNKEPIFHMCKQMITHKLLENDISFQKNNKSFLPSLQIQDSISEYWKVFIQGFVDQVFAFGFAMVTISKDNIGRKYPSIIDPNLVNVSIEILHGNQSFVIQSTEIEPSDILVYDQFGFHPYIKGGVGTFTSLAFKVMPYVHFLKTLRFDCGQMETNKSNPQFFSEVSDTSRERQEGVDFDYYAEADASEISEDMQFSRNKTNLEILNKQKEFYDMQMGNHRAVKKLENIVQLPSGHSIKSTPQNTGRQDIVQLHKVTQEIICTTLGVPRALLVADGQYSSSTDGVEMLFGSTLKWWKHQVESTITDLYTKIYVTKPKLHKNIYLTKQRQQVRLILPTTLEVDMDQLTSAYQMGIINWETYSLQIVKQLKLPLGSRITTAPLQNINAPEVVPMSNQRKRPRGRSDTGTAE